MSENLTTITENKGKSIKVLVEKLDGGYISDITGRRAIFKDAFAVVDAMDLEEVIKNMDNAEYHLDINIIPKSEYADYNALVALHNSSEEELTLESAKASGLIHKEVFNPLGAEKVTEPDIHSPIKVTIANAYNAERLSSIKWQELHEQLPLLPSEITKITGMNTTTLYASLPKVRSGKMSFQHSNTRVGFTILAQYYERILGIRTSTKDQCEKMKDDMGKMIRTLEILGSGKSHVKTSEVQKILLDMRKLLM